MLDPLRADLAGSSSRPQPARAPRRPAPSPSSRTQCPASSGTWRTDDSPNQLRVYLVTHPGHSAAKIGVTDAGGSRLRKHSQRGWQILATVQVPGELALSIEKAILDWWRGEFALPVHLGQPEMPHGGWTETVDSTEIDLAATIQRINDLAAASN